MRPPEQRAIESLLIEKLRIAREWHEKAKQELQLAVSETPTETPSPDGARIQTASDSARYAWKAYQVAINRFYDFVLNGKVPEDLDTSIEPR